MRTGFFTFGTLMLCLGAAGAAAQAEGPPSFAGVSYAVKFPPSSGTAPIMPAIPSAAQVAQWKSAAAEVASAFANESTAPAGVKKLETLAAGAWPPLRAARLKMPAAARDRLDAALPAYLYRTFDEREKMVLEAKEYDRVGMQVAYEQVGEKNPKWDGEVREALRMICRERPVNVGSQPFDLLRLAQIKGCKDPLVLCEMMYVYTAECKQYFLPGDYILEADAMLASKYPAVVKCAAELDVLYAYNDCQKSGVGGKKATSTFAESFRQQPVIDAHLKQAMALLERDAAANPAHEDAIMEVFSRIVSFYIQGTESDEKAIDIVYPHMIKAFADNPAAYLRRGQLLVNTGWKMRGSGSAAETTEGQFRFFEQYLGAAEESLTKAWSLDPSCEAACAAMLSAGVGLGYPSDKERMWCDRAMAIDPLCYGAPGELLQYLQPRWHGTREEMKTTADAYVNANKRPDSLIRTLRILATELILNDMSTKNEGIHFEASGLPPNWVAIARDYDAFIKDNPTNYNARYDYARLATVGFLYEAARAQFAIIGDHLNDDLPADYFETRENAYQERHLLLHAYSPLDNELREK